MRRAESNPADPLDCKMLVAGLYEAGPHRHQTGLTEASYKNQFPRKPLACLFEHLLLCRGPRAYSKEGFL